MHYREIEFVCVNSSSETATPLEAQEALYARLARLDGVYVYRLDFTDEHEVQVMMAAVLLDPTAEGAVRAAASECGVEIDLVGEVEERELFRLRRSIAAGTEPFFMPPPPAKPSPDPHPSPRGRTFRALP